MSRQCAPAWPANPARMQKSKKWRPAARSRSTPAVSCATSRAASHRRFHSDRLRGLGDTLPRALRNGNAVRLALRADRIATFAGKHDLVDVLGAGEAGNRDAKPLGLGSEP